MKIFYMGLEPYEGRYTLQLQDWTERAYKKRVATRCRVCGGQLLESSEIKKEMHDKCNKDNSNMYLM